MRKFPIICFLFSFLIGTNCLGQHNIGTSPSGYLTSLPPEIPKQISPSDSTPNLPEEFNLIWKKQIHTSSYSVQISKESDFNSLVIDQQNFTDTVLLVTWLENKTLYYWRVSALNVAGESNFSQVWSFTTSPATGIELQIESLSKDVILEPPYPNPFQNLTTIKYYIPEKATVEIDIYNSIGQPIRKLVSEEKQAGEYEVLWDGKDNNGIPLPTGLYICVLSTNKNRLSKSFLLNR